MSLIFYIEVPLIEPKNKKYQVIPAEDLRPGMEFKIIAVKDTGDCMSPDEVVKLMNIAYEKGLQNSSVLE